MLDLLPNDPHTLSAHGLGAQQLDVQWFGSS
jgi:hypothetical protein